MKIWHKALILAVVTESLTIAWFFIARARGGATIVPAILHAPAIFLIFHGWPWLLTLLIETSLWMLFWFLLLRLFVTPKDELAVPSFADHQREWQEPHVKKIGPS
jgi:hypothetical protein